MFVFPFRSSTFLILPLLVIFFCFSFFLRVCLSLFLIFTVVFLSICFVLPPLVPCLLSHSLCFLCSFLYLFFSFLLPVFLSLLRSFLPSLFPFIFLCIFHFLFIPPYTCSFYPSLLSPMPVNSFSLHLFLLLPPTNLSGTNCE